MILIFMEYWLWYKSSRECVNSPFILHMRADNQAVRVKGRHPELDFTEFQTQNFLINAQC